MKKIICTSRIYKVHPDRERDSDLWIIDVDSKTVKEFLTWPEYSISNPSYSPDGTQISFSAQNIKNRHATQAQLAVIATAGGKPQIISGPLDRDVNGAQWTADSKTIYFATQTRVTFRS